MDMRRLLKTAAIKKVYLILIYLTRKIYSNYVQEVFNEDIK